MGLQVPFAPYLLVFFFSVTVTIYLERLRPIKLIKKNNKIKNEGGFDRYLRPSIYS